MRVSSYNVLAPSYVKKAYYPDVNPRHLDEDWRLDALIHKIAALPADVLCLQEVERKVFEALQQALPEHVGHFAKKKCLRPDGCATFVRPSLRPQLARAHYYPDGTGHLVLLVECEKFGVANTHLRWGATPEVTLGQAEALIAQLSKDKPWIVCGDFNADAKSAALAAMRAAGLDDVHACQPNAYTCNSNRRAKRIDFIMSALPAHALPLPAISDTTPLPNDDEPSDHLVISADVES